MTNEAHDEIVHMVAWRDASSSVAWHSRDECLASKSHALSLITSIGYMHGWDEHSITLAQNVDRDTDAASETITIPVATIVSHDVWIPDSRVLADDE